MKAEQVMRKMGALPMHEIAGQRAAIRALESTISQPHRGARRIAETPEATDPPHGAVRKG